MDLEGFLFRSCNLPSVVNEKAAVPFVEYANTAVFGLEERNT